MGAMAAVLEPASSRTLQDRMELQDMVDLPPGVTDISRRFCPSPSPSLALSVSVCVSVSVSRLCICLCRYLSLSLSLCPSVCLSVAGRHLDVATAPKVERRPARPFPQHRREHAHSLSHSHPTHTRARIDSSARTGTRTVVNTHIAPHMPHTSTCTVGTSTVPPRTLHMPHTSTSTVGTSTVPPRIVHCGHQHRTTKNRAGKR